MSELDRTPGKAMFLSWTAGQENKTQNQNQSAICPNQIIATRLRRLDQTPSGNVIQTHDIGIVDWEGNVDDIMEVIRKKCARAYPNNYLLLVDAPHSGNLLDFDRVIDEMKASRSAFLEVWIVTFIGPGDIKWFVSCQASPSST